MGVRDKEKLKEYIELLNEGYIPKGNELDKRFKSGEVIGQYWHNHKAQIKSELDYNINYKDGYILAKSVVNERVTKTLKNKTFNKRRNEYINLINEGYIPVEYEENKMFSDGTPISQYWHHNKNKIAHELNNNPKYSVGYEKAKEIVSMRMKNTHKYKVEEYIELLNNGYIPKSSDSITKFSDGKKINSFWKDNKDTIINELKTNLKYKKDYNVARESISKYLEKRNKKLTVNVKIAEFIEKLNNGYKPRYYDSKLIFSDGIVNSGFYLYYSSAIKKELNENPKYNVGYDEAKKNIINFTPRKGYDDRLKEYIELLNNGYIPKINDITSSFFDGRGINTFYMNNQEKIMEVLFSSDYDEGYELSRKVAREAYVYHSFSYLKEFINKNISNIEFDSEKVNTMLSKKYDFITNKKIFFKKDETLFEYAMKNDIDYNYMIKYIKESSSSYEESIYEIILTYKTENINYKTKIHRYFENNIDENYMWLKRAFYFLVIVCQNEKLYKAYINELKTKYNVTDDEINILLDLLSKYELSNLNIKSLNKRL